MSEGIIIALITQTFGLLGVIITVLFSNKKTTKNIKAENNKVANDIKTEFIKFQAVTDEKITELTREVREHNNFARRMPVVEEHIKNVEEKVNHFHNI